MERLIPQKQASCPTGAWHALLEAINKTTDRVTIRRERWDAVAACHAERFGERSGLIFHEQTRTRLTVDRLSLFEFVRAHGKLHEEE